MAMEARSSETLSDARPGKRLIEGDNGALLIAMRGGGIRQLVDGKVEAYPLPGSGGSSGPIGCSGIAMAVCGSERRTRVSCMCTREGRICLRGLTVSQAISFKTLFEDREGNIWVATSDGLDRFRDFAVPTISVKQGLSNASRWVRSGGQGWQRLAWHS